MKEIIQKAKEYALSEINKNGTPAIDHFDLTNKKGQEIAKKLGVNKDIVMLGTILMDLKLGECLKENKISEHIERSSKAVQEFLKEFNLNEETKNKIINCIEAHHKTKEYICTEAEICANADCYRMLSPRGAFAYIVLLSERDSNLEKILEQWEYKIEEKYKILSLDICKSELDKYYFEFKKLIERARKQ